MLDSLRRLATGPKYSMVRLRGLATYGTIFSRHATLPGALSDVNAPFAWQRTAISTRRSSIRALAHLICTRTAWSLLVLRRHMLQS